MNLSIVCSFHNGCPCTKSGCFQHFPILVGVGSRDLYENKKNKKKESSNIESNEKSILNTPGFVPINDPSSVHFGMRGSNVWKNAHIQMATSAAKTP